MAKNLSGETKTITMSSPSSEEILKVKIRQLSHAVVFEADVTLLERRIKNIKYNRAVPLSGLRRA